MKHIAGLLLIIGYVFCEHIYAQDIERNVEERLKAFLQEYTTRTGSPGGCRLDSFRIDFLKKRLDIYASEQLAYQPWRKENVDAVYRQFRQILPGPVNYFETALFSDGRKIEELVPNYFRKGKKDETRLFRHIDTGQRAWVSNVSSPCLPSRGLLGKHIALWQSHGLYYNNDKEQWNWQRPRLFCTTEDLFTQSFVLPYLMPMLEKAGAYVYTPRERDTQRQEVIVDNDTPRSATRSLYIEGDSRKSHWQTIPVPGFAQTKEKYEDGENPFVDGTSRFILTEKKKDRAFAEWIPDIPESGEYAVYVSYQSLPSSVRDAKYMVFHTGGITEFKVNQQIGGNTWVYLGTFPFEKGSHEYGMVVLSNESQEKGVVSADAVRFGGGMGNVVRNGQNSGFPRYAEGARYAAQWSGMPYEVYAGYKGANDYADDINTRSKVVNYLSGGSPFNPGEPGKRVPFEMTLALHSDAGFSHDDQIIGTLGIYTTRFNEGKLSAGTDRYASRDLADILMTQLQQDIRSTFNVDWTRRSMWNRNYSETRLPAVPSVIIELLSHQNFADMQLGHDPHFKFTAARALYKGVLRYLCCQHNEEYVVQPLPVTHFAVRFGKKKNTLELSWKGQEDALEPTAHPQEYILYTRIGRGGFDNGVRITKPFTTIKIEPGLVYSFKVTAVNRGGESFPSEILTAYKDLHEQGRVLIVNGFNRISGPTAVHTADEAGFDVADDPGVPYLYNLSLCGQQTCFSRQEAGKSLGESTGEYEVMKIAGNTFDYPFVHGKAIQKAGGYSFVSCSDEALLEAGFIMPEEYPIVDYIMGLEKEDKAIHPFRTGNYKTFPLAVQRLLTSYCKSGGSLLVSGAYVGSDMALPADKAFTQTVLKYSFGGQVRSEDASLGVQGMNQQGTLFTRPNEKCYAVTSSDCLLPAASAFTAAVYGSGRESAAVAYRGSDYRTFVMGFPFESISEESVRNAMMRAILRFLTRT